MNTSYFVILERRWTYKKSSEFLESECYLLHNVENRTVFSSRKNKFIFAKYTFAPFKSHFFKFHMSFCVCVVAWLLSFLYYFFIVPSLVLLFFPSLKFSKFRVVGREIWPNEVNLVNECGMSYMWYVLFNTEVIEGGQCDNKLSEEIKRIWRNQGSVNWLL